MKATVGAMSFEGWGSADNGDPTDGPETTYGIHDKQLKCSDGGTKAESKISRPPAPDACAFALASTGTYSLKNAVANSVTEAVLPISVELKWKEIIQEWIRAFLVLMGLVKFRIPLTRATLTVRFNVSFDGPYSTINGVAKSEIEILVRDSVGKVMIAASKINRSYSFAPHPGDNTKLDIFQTGLLIETIASKWEWAPPVANPIIALFNIAPGNYELVSTLDITSESDNTLSMDATLGTTFMV